MDVIASVRKEVNCPIIVGGGIKSQEQAEQAWMAGANWVVMGNIFEEDPSVLENWK
jgi:putative glycerol-1-phosphate prenyltransferase